MSTRSRTPATSFDASSADGATRADHAPSSVHGPGPVAAPDGVGGTPCAGAAPTASAARPAAEVAACSADAGGATAHVGDAARRDARVGVLYGVAAYGFWGLVPVYFKAVAHVSAWEVLAHRVAWSVVFLAVLVVARRGWGAVWAVARDRRLVLTLAVTTLLIAGNWFGFIWAVGHDLVMQASLGYFINPLVNVLLGFVFLGERLRRWQMVSVGLAAVGVGYMTVAAGEVPLIALGLAGTFGFYGLLRKKTRVDAIVGLTVETSLLMPVAVVFLGVLAARGEAAFVYGGWATSGLLMAAGVVTAVPLLWFAAAARRLRLATLGFLQYLAPTGHFLLAVLAYGEPFTRVHGVTFALIWTALAIYSADTYRGQRVLRAARQRAGAGADRHGR